MAPSLLSAIESMQQKIEALTANVEEIREQNRQLKEENEELRRQVKSAGEERDRMRLDAEFLSVSHKLADNPDTLVDARRHIAQLIRNIDRCIEMLKE